ncbi:MAG TPA: DUF2264 domain-containing protein [Bacteroidales bacterium]|nr:DUF2264 domain-containing protein [Bacteroidales bacterium]
MKNKIRLLASISMVFVLFCYTVIGQSNLKGTMVSPTERNHLKAPNNFKNSPYSGYTREHWLEITEKIIAGVLPYFDKKTGMPFLPFALGDEAFEKLQSPKSDGKPLGIDMIEGRIKPKRPLERIMMAVIIYTTATGKDNVPGYEGSISSPFIKAITKGTDPDDQDFWGDPVPYDQVGSIFALGIYLNPKFFWDPLGQKQKENLLNYFKKQTLTQTYAGNHYYFHMTAVPLLEKYGYESNREYYTQMFERLMGWYRGDGWFLDGVNRGFDYYNMWGFQLYNQVLDKFDQTWHLQFGSEIKRTTDRFLETFPYFFGRDGGPVPWGRSLSYRFASNAAIAWAVINHTSTLPPGEARRIASGSLKYFWEHGCLGENNLLNVGFWGDNAGAGEKYLYPGDPYFATMGLACLLIPESDPFWTSVEEPMPADGAGGKLAVPGAQFVFRVSPIDGESRMFPVGQPLSQSRSVWQNGAKYDQHAYSSYLGWCVTWEDQPDIGAGRSGYSYDGVKWYYRERARPVLIESDHLVSTYPLKPKKEDLNRADFSRDEIITHTLVGNDGEIHIFWHNNPDPIFLHIGSYGIGVPHGTDLVREVNKQHIIIKGGDYYSELRPLNAPEGKLDAVVLEPVEGWKHTHLFGGKGAYPFWHSSAPIPPNTPMIFYTNGTRGRLPGHYAISIQKYPGLIKIQFEGKLFEINIPY